MYTEVDITIICWLCVSLWVAVMSWPSEEIDLPLGQESQVFAFAEGAHVDYRSG